MITQKDIEKLKEVFATKNELNDLQNTMQKGFDELVGLIMNINNRLEAVVDNHEQRITKLEDKALFAG